jgi:hypothetical protein
MASIFKSILVECHALGLRQARCPYYYGRLLHNIGSHTRIASICEKQKKTRAHRTRSIRQPWARRNRRSNTRYDTGHRPVFAQIQQGVLANPVKPDAAAGVSIAHTHRHQANRQTVVGREVKTSRDDVTGKDGRTGAQPVIRAILAGNREVGAGEIIRWEIVQARFLSAGLGYYAGETKGRRNPHQNPLPQTHRRPPGYLDISQPPPV